MHFGEFSLRKTVDKIQIKIILQQQLTKCWVLHCETSTAKVADGLYTLCILVKPLAALLNLKFQYLFHKISYSTSITGNNIWILTSSSSSQTAISYICSNGLIQFLDIFLQLPNIDANKADNEGNTPLHFAAEAGKWKTWQLFCSWTILTFFLDIPPGRSEIINMLITRCRTLTLDKKNHLGFTPLMKAALQGRTKCAKLLLFAGECP